MPLGSPCGFPHLHVTEVLFPNAPLLFAGTAHVSSENIAGVLLSSHFVSKHFREKGRCGVGSETLLDSCKEYRTIIYEVCTLDTRSRAYASNQSVNSSGLWAGANVCRSGYRHGIVAAAASACATG